MGKVLAFKRPTTPATLEKTGKTDDPLNKTPRVYSVKVEVGGVTLTDVVGARSPFSAVLSSSRHWGSRFCLPKPGTIRDPSPLVELKCTVKLLGDLDDLPGDRFNDLT